MLSRFAARSTPLVARRALLPVVASAPCRRLTERTGPIKGAWDGRNANMPRQPRATGDLKDEDITSSSSSSSASTPSSLSNAGSGLGSDAPLREQAKEMASELRSAAKDIKGSLRDTVKRASSKVAGKIEEQLGGDRNEQRRPLHTSAAPRVRDSDIQDLRDDARRVGQKASNRMSQAGIEIKEKSQEMMHGAKKVGRRIKDAVKDAVDDMATPGTAARGASETIPPEARHSDSEPVRDAARSEVLSTSRNRRGASVMSPSAQSGSDPVLEPVGKSTLWDGPQEMPQGVGQRAHDETGRPMETGGRRT